MHKHHLFQSSIFRRPAIRQFFETVWPEFHPDDYARNGILLPANDVVARSNRRPIHDGPHPRYNEFVARMIEAIRAAWRPDDKVSTVVSRASLRAFNRRLFAALGQGREEIFSIDEIEIFIDFPAQRRRFDELDEIARSWPAMSVSCPILEGNREPTNSALPCHS